MHQNTPGVLVRTDIPLCCDLMRALCAPNKLLPSSINYPSCLYYNGQRSLDGRCILNTPITTEQDPRMRKSNRGENRVYFQTVADYLCSLLPICAELMGMADLQARAKEFAELRHGIYSALAVDAINVKGKVR